MRPLSPTLLSCCQLVLAALALASRAEAQLVQKSIPYENETRTWFEHVPASYNGSNAVPLVIALHGAYSSGNEFAPRSGWSGVADAKGFIVIYPNGKGNVWNSWVFDGSKPDDIGFLLKVITQVEATYKIDPRRVYMTGFSNGGGMTSFFTAYHADLLAAIAPMSAGWVTNTGNSDSILHPDALIPAWMWRGANDPTSDTPSVFVQDQQQTAFWVKLNGDGTIPKTSKVRNDTTKVYSGKAEVRFTSVAGLGHDVEAGSTARIWNEFFSRASRVNGAVSATSPTTVKLGVATPKAYPARGTKGSFLIGRDGDTSADLTVAYEVSGSAVSGTDYKALPGTVTLPACETSKKVKVRALTVEGAKGKKTVRLSLLPGDGYTVDDPPAGKVKIVEDE